MRDPFLYFSQWGHLLGQKGKRKEVTRIPFTLWTTGSPSSSSCGHGELLLSFWTGMAVAAIATIGKQMHALQLAVEQGWEIKQNFPISLYLQGISLGPLIEPGEMGGISWPCSSSGFDFSSPSACLYSHAESLIIALVFSPGFLMAIIGRESRAHLFCLYWIFLSI